MNLKAALTYRRNHHNNQQQLQGQEPLLRSMGAAGGV